MKWELWPSPLPNCDIIQSFRLKRLLQWQNTHLGSWLCFWLDSIGNWLNRLVIVVYKLLWSHAVRTSPEKRLHWREGNVCFDKSFQGCKKKTFAHEFEWTNASIKRLLDLIVPKSSNSEKQLYDTIAVCLYYIYIA